LLRFLESNEIHPIGEPNPHKVDVRVVAATNADLKARVSNGEFREDLYYRLSIVPIHLAPLRERRGEILPLARHYLAKYSREFRKGDLRLDEETMDCLVLFRWPGNVRQLSNEMRRVAAMAEIGAVVMPEHLNSEIRRSQTVLPFRSEARANEVLVRLDQPMSAAIEYVERAMVINALKKTDGLLEPAAKMLGLSRKGLYLKRQRYQIEEQLPPGPELSDVK
jgi:hydrogenase-4 transcriptional activator